MSSVRWDDLDIALRDLIETDGETVIRLTRNPRFFVVDTRGLRWWGSRGTCGTPENKVHIHSFRSTLEGARDAGRYSIRWNHHPAFPDRHEYFIVVQARTMTQVKNWLLGSDFPSVRRPTMGTRKQELDARVDALSRELARLVEEKDRLSSRPEEPGFDPSTEGFNVVQFRKRYSPHGRMYRFAAIQTSEDDWYITGRETTRYTWDGLLDFIDSEGLDYDPGLLVATGWGRVGGA